MPSETRRWLRLRRLSIVCAPDVARRNETAFSMLPGARQPARVGMEHTALKLTDPAVLRMVAAGWQGE